MALGAQRHDVIALVARDASRLLAAGVVLGIIGAISSHRVVSALLFDVEPIDLLTVAVVAGTLVAAAVAASYLPARRAVRLDPVSALEAE